MNKKGLLPIIAGLVLASGALADEGVKERRSWYFGASVVPEVFVVDLEDGDADGLIANSFAGVGGTVQLCKRHVGFDFLDVCLGGHAFRSLTSGAENATFIDGSGAVVGVQSEADITTFGAFGQAKINAGGFYLGPYAGLRRINTDLDFDAGSLLPDEEIDDTAVFGGAEIGFNAFNRRVEFGVTGEGGTSVSETDFRYGRFGGFLRAKF